MKNLLIGSIFTVIASQVCSPAQAIESTTPLKDRIDQKSILKKICPISDFYPENKPKTDQKSPQAQADAPQPITAPESSPMPQETEKQPEIDEKKATEIQEEQTKHDMLNNFVPTKTKPEPSAQRKYQPQTRFKVHRGRFKQRLARFKTRALHAR